MNLFGKIFSKKEKRNEDNIAIKKECPHKNRRYFKKAIYNSWPAAYYICNDCGQEGVDCSKKWF